MQHQGLQGTVDPAFEEKARALRPFYFIVVVWGQRYTDFLMNFCIPALLSPGNIPALRNRGKNKFLIATTDEDWARMQDRPIFHRLREYVEPVLVRIPPCPEAVSGCVHMGIGHKLATQMAYEARAYSVLLTPDLMVSDGTMANVQRRAVEGAHVVLVAALRFGEEPLFEQLARMGIADINSRFGDHRDALVLTGRELVRAGIKSFHSETLRYEWRAPYFSGHPVACWWKVPGEEGVVLHSLSWAPLLVDYDAVEHHDTALMDHWTIDGDYVHRNFGLNSHVYVVHDSDEAMLVSWAPMADRAQSLEPRRYLRYFGDLARGMVLYEYFHSPVFDPLKRRIFFEPVFWHADDLTDSFKRVEERVQRLLLTYLPLNESMRREGSRQSPLRVAFTRMAVRIFRFATGLVVRLSWLTDYYWSGKARILGVAGRAMRGDPEAIRRVKRNLRYFWAQLTGRSTTSGG